MAVCWYLLCCKCDDLHTTLFPYLISGSTLRGSHVYWCAALKIRKGKSLLAVAAISGTDQIEKRFVLRYRQQLACTHGPPGGRKATAKHSDLTNVRTRHNLFLSFNECQS